MGMFPEIQALYKLNIGLIYIYMVGTSNKSVPDMAVECWQLVYVTSLGAIRLSWDMSVIHCIENTAV